jgi:hypothetical protein
LYGNKLIVALAFLALGAAWLLGRRKSHNPLKNR